MVSDGVSTSHPPPGPHCSQASVGAHTQRPRPSRARAGGVHILPWFGEKSGVMLLGRGQQPAADGCLHDDCLKMSWCPARRSHQQRRAAARTAGQHRMGPGIPASSLRLSGSARMLGWQARNPLATRRHQGHVVTGAYGMGFAPPSARDLRNERRSIGKKQGTRCDTGKEKRCQRSLVRTATAPTGCQ